MTIVELTNDNFESEVIKSDRPVLIDFWAPWCRFCQKFDPIFDEVRKHFSGKLKFCKLNIDDHPDVEKKYILKAIPCLILIKHGKEIGRIVGIEDKELIIEKIESHINDMI